MAYFNREELKTALKYWYEHLEVNNQEQNEAVWCAINTIRYCIWYDSKYTEERPQVTVFAENASKEEIEDFKQELENVLEKTQGEWNEWTDERWGGTKIYCPYCKEKALIEYRDGLYRQVKSNFCPNCGAKMKGDEE